jgi:hypothetical protein
MDAQRANRPFLPVSESLTAAQQRQACYQCQIEIESPRPNDHSVQHEIGICARCKDTYEPTIQQSRETKTPFALSQAEKTGSQKEKSRGRKTAAAGVETKRDFAVQSRRHRGGFFNFDTRAPGKLKRLDRAAAAKLEVRMKVGVSTASRLQVRPQGLSPGCLNELANTYFLKILLCLRINPPCS